MTFAIFVKDTTRSNKYYNISLLLSTYIYLKYFAVAPIFFKLFAHIGWKTVFTAKLNSDLYIYKFMVYETSLRI